MKKTKKGSVKISNFEGVSKATMSQVLGGSTNYNISKSNTGNVVAPDPNTNTVTSTLG
jgi:hypothetical protein